MKTIEKKIEKKIEETIVTYVAGDGKEFRDETECRKYEESAIFAVSVLLKNKVLFDLQAAANGENRIASAYFGIDSLLSNCYDYDIYIFKPKTKDDIENFLKYNKLLGTDLFRKNDWTYAKRYSKEDQEEFRKKFKDNASDVNSWDDFRLWSTADELKTGETYIFIHEDDWCNLYSFSRYKKTVDNYLSAWDKWADSVKTE